MPRIAAQLEGEISDQPQLVNGNVEFTVLGVKVVVRPSAADNRRIRTPTDRKDLKLDELASADKLPGRDVEGFKGCTAIVAGNFNTDPDPARGIPANVLVVDYNEDVPAPPPADPFEYHPLVEVGPPESEMLGPLTQRPAAGPMTVNGVEVRVLKEGDDPRLIPAEPANDFGIAIDLARVPLLTPVGVEGYPASDGKFVGFAIVVEDDSPRILKDPVHAQVGVTRAQARVRGGQVEYEIRGGVYTGSAPSVPPFQSIEIFGVFTPGASGTRLGRSRAEAAPRGFDGWRFSTSLPIPPPIEVFARYHNAPGGAVDSEPTPLDVRDDPDSPPPP